MMHGFIIRHNLPVISTVFFKKSAVTRRANTRRVKKHLKVVLACDEETIVRLNLLAKSSPFCVWHRQRDNDPL